MLDIEKIKKELAEGADFAKIILELAEAINELMWNI